MARGRSLTEFQKEFPDEASCAAFLFERRWPDGLVCPSCGGNRAAALKSRAYTLRVLWLPSSDFDHGGRGDAPHAAAADGVVSGPHI
jgi:Transposase zinc-ribbon domain